MSADETDLYIVSDPVNGLLGEHPWIPGATFRSHPGLAEWLAVAVGEYLADPEAVMLKATCPWWLSQHGIPGREGANGPNTCASGCYSEPACQTG